MRNRLVAIVAFVVAYVVARAAVPAVRDYFRSPADKAVTSALHQTSSSDLAELEAYFDAHGIQSGADAARATAKLSAAGMLRLSDEELRERAGLLRRVMERLPVPECAMVARLGAASIGKEALVKVLNRWVRAVVCVAGAPCDEVRSSIQQQRMQLGWATAPEGEPLGQPRERSNRELLTVVVPWIFYSAQRDGDDRARTPHSVERWGSRAWP